MNFDYKYYIDVCETVSESNIMKNNIVIINQANLQKLEETAIRCLIRKLDQRLFPYLSLIEIASYISRITFGHAKSMNMATDLNLTEYDFKISISLFFLGYLISTIPNYIIIRYIGPTRYLSLSMIVWGSFTIGMSFIKNGSQLQILQFFLGITQAGFFPSMIIYISLWYRKRDQILRIAILVEAAIVASALGGILGYGFKHMDDIRDLHDWQWMFLLEGVPMIPLGIITFLFLSSVPNTVQWLNNIEKQLLTNILRDDAGRANRENIGFSLRQVSYTFKDVRVYLYALIAFGNLGVLKYLNTYLPVILNDTNDSEVDSHLRATLSYIFAFLYCLLVNYSSWRRHEFGFHIMFCFSFTAIGFSLMSVLIDQNKIVAYVGKCIACSGSFAAYPLIVSWLTNNVSGHTKRSMAVCLVMGIGQIGGIIMPFLHSDEMIYQRNNFICIGAVMTSFIFTIILRTHLMIENRRRNHLSQEQYDREAAVKDPCDWHPEVRYIL